MESFTTDNFLSVNEKSQGTIETRPKMDTYSPKISHNLGESRSVSEGGKDLNIFLVATE